MNSQILLDTIGAASATLAFPGTVELALLNLGALMPAPRAMRRTRLEGKLAVVIPAHNEEASIGDCLDSLFRCDSLELVDVYVVADNCTDDTATVATARGACVMERRDDEKRGKGQALAFAFGRLAAYGYAAFVVVDADSRLEPNFFTETAAAFAGGSDAVQCPYLVANPNDSRSTRLMDLALRGFNLVRPMSRGRLGFSAGILGNGWGVTAETLRKIPYRAGSVVEDLEYHLELLRYGVRVDYLGSTAIYGAMPAGGRGRETQRARWEGGRLRMLRERGVELIAGTLRGNVRMGEVLLDLLLLPLGYFVPLLICCLILPTHASRLVGSVGLLAVAVHVACCVRAGGSWVRDLTVLATTPAYVAWKFMQIPRVVGTSFKRAQWIRTARPMEAK